MDNDLSARVSPESRKIERVELLAVVADVPLTTWAGLPPVKMAETVVRVWDSDGCDGVGGSQSFSTHGYDLSQFEACRVLARATIGMDPDAREAVSSAIAPYVIPATPGARGALDIALWDMAARRAGEPLYKYLGAAHSRLLAYASTPELNSPEDYVSFVHEFRDQGFRAFKFHASNIAEDDIEMLRTVRDAFPESDELSFMHDAENKYSRQDAFRVASLMEELGYEWLEAPFVDYDVDGYCDLRQRVNLPLVPHGLWFVDLRSLVRDLARRPWDAVRFETSAVGGISVARKLTSIGEGFGLGSEIQSWGFSLLQAANLHLALATPGTSYFECPVPYAAYEYGVINPIRPAPDGFVYPEDRPGLGMDVDWEAKRAAAVTSDVVS